MDWKNAKSILIIVLFLLNIVLAVTLYNNLKVEEISEETITNTSTILRQNNVHIECPIPKYVGKDYTLKYVEGKLDKEKIAAALLGENYTEVGTNSYKNNSKALAFKSNSYFEFTDIGSNNIKNASTDFKDYVNDYLKSLSKKEVIPFDEFELDGYYPDLKSGNEARVVYKGCYKDYSVFDNYIDVRVSSSGIYSIKYHYNKPISITKKKDTYVVPVYEILLTKMTEYEGITIKNVDIGFKRLSDRDNETSVWVTSYEGLSWRIKTYDGQEYYFSARE